VALRTYLEIERVSSLGETHSDIRSLSTIPFNPQNEVSGTIENRFNLIPRRSISDLSEELSCGRVLSVSYIFPFLPSTYL
jgi:hypothetical protein